MFATVIAITGGFVIDAGPLYFSAHRLLPSFVVAAAAYALAMRQGRSAVVTADTALSDFLHTHAFAIVVVLAAAAAGAGVGYGTYVAAASDPSAYLNQARTIVHGGLEVPVPLASRVSWPDPERILAPLGFRPGLRAETVVPTYPPGLPLLMAAALLVAGQHGPFLVAPFFAALTVLGTYWLAVRLHSRTAGVIAAALMATSPLMLSQVVQLLSDIPATALWTLALLAALARRPMTAGAVSGFAALVRPSLIPVGVVIGIVLAIDVDRRAVRGREAISTLVRFAAAMIPGLAVLAVIQWSLYGDPLASGHGTFGEMFSVTNVLPNIRAYTMRVLTGETPALALIAASMIVLAAVRSAPAGLQMRTRPTAPSVRIAALIAAPVLTCYLAYGVFTDWAYLRFLLPIWPAAVAAAGSIVFTATLRLPAVARTQVLLIALTAVCARNVMTAAHEGAFTLWIDASRYGTAGRYLDAVLPKAAVIVASQHSGSATYYTGRPIVRWDWFDGGFDEALNELVRLGRPPVIVVEDWEEPLLRRRFPTSIFARLDWPARADFGRATRVRLFDPADRERPTGRPPDRVP
jgi:hypothetical protein